MYTDAMTNARGMASSSPSPAASTALIARHNPTSSILRERPARLRKHNLHFTRVASIQGSASADLGHRQVASDRRGCHLFESRLPTVIHLG
jgi:hypothetical protein